MKNRDDLEISGLGFRGYRSAWGDEFVKIGPLEKINLLAGKNNSGKSNILRFTQDQLPRVFKRTNTGFDAKEVVPSADIPVSGQAGQQLGILLAFSLDEQWFKESLGTGVNDRTKDTVFKDLKAALETGIFQSESIDLFWVELTPTKKDGYGRGGFEITPDQCISAEKALRNSESRPGNSLEIISSTLTRTQGGGQGASLLRILNWLRDQLKTPKVETIGAFRKVSESGEKYSGANLIEELAGLQNPNFERRKDKIRFNEINNFVKVVLEDESASIEVPHDRSTLLVHHEGRVLPLDSVGTGIHEVVILAAAATVLKDTLVCIEEPEIHLHPLLQKKLLTYLKDHTDNRYLIATHSAHLLDSAISSIFHVSLDESGTHVDRAVSSDQVAKISSELGFRASDLVQSNCIIWVEGPSDRIYIRHWISLIRADLIEGVHYSIMFYGGGLLNHLSPSDIEIEDFISLKRINRNLVVVIDSDKKTRGAQINATKKRVRDAFDEGTGFAWITKGYTIENYVPKNLLAQAIECTHPGSKSLWDGGLYENPLSGENITPRKSSANKVLISKFATRNWESEQSWPHDLKKQVSRLVKFICDSNDIYIHQSTPERQH